MSTVFLTTSSASVWPSTTTFKIYAIQEPRQRAKVVGGLAKKKYNRKPIKCTVEVLEG
jgi:hypothetical protein